MTTDQADLKESHEQMRAAWSLYARSCPDGEVIDAAGLCLANARQPWALMNAALLPAPEASDADLAAHATAAIRYYQQENRPWFLAVSQPWLGDGGEAMLAGLGLGRTGSPVGMVSDQLAPPRRALPDVETRRIDDEAGRLALADLNAAAYGASPDWARRSFSATPCGTRRCLDTTPIPMQFSIGAALAKAEAMTSTLSSGYNVATRAWSRQSPARRRVFWKT
ncbi:MAG: hypothetical protein NTY67_05930 [Cyanobacteria bacterium]|nr:hypothetical protein [Cyanobacteriota bacterium]